MKIKKYLPDFSMRLYKNDIMEQTVYFDIFSWMKFLPDSPKGNLITLNIYGPPYVYNYPLQEESLKGMTHVEVYFKKQKKYLIRAEILSYGTVNTTEDSSVMIRLRGEV